MSVAVSESATLHAKLEGSSYRIPSGELILLRHCRGLVEFEGCVDLQQETWGLPERELVPRKRVLLAQELGGQVIGAFDASGRLVACAMAMAAIARTTEARPRTYLHSHLLAVRGEYRSSGIGSRLKLVQREDALERGIELMTWTFDPTAARNANLNLHRLGAVARRYSADFYGVSSSRLQAGLPSDRLHAEWWLRSSRVCTQVERLLEASSHGVSTAPQPEGTSDTTAVRTIPLPAAVETWKASSDDLSLARALQEANGELFQQAFADGLVATDFRRDSAGDGVYVLSRWDPLPASHHSSNLKDAL